MSVVDMAKIEKQYPGQWVALSDDRRRVVASGFTLKDALAKARGKGIKDPILSKVPKESLEYLL